MIVRLFRLLLNKNNDCELTKKFIGERRKKIQIQFKEIKKFVDFTAIYFILIYTSKIIFECRFSFFRLLFIFKFSFHSPINVNPTLPVGKIKTKKRENFKLSNFFLVEEILEVSLIKRFSAPNLSR